MNPEDNDFKKTYEDMQAFKTDLQASMNPGEFDQIYYTLSLLIKGLMIKKDISSIDAAEFFANELAANSTFSQDHKDVYSAMFVLVGLEMMGEDFIQSFLN